MTRGLKGVLGNRDAGPSLPPQPRRNSFSGLDDRHVRSGGDGSEPCPFLSCQSAPFLMILSDAMFYFSGCLGKIC